MLPSEAERLGGFSRAVNLGLISMSLADAVMLYDSLLPSSALHTVVQSLDSHIFTALKVTPTISWPNETQFLFDKGPTSLKALAFFFRVDVHRAAMRILWRKSLQQGFLQERVYYWGDSFTKGFRFRHFCLPEKLQAHMIRLKAARPGLSEITNFVKTHDLAAINARFNTCARGFDYLFEKITQRQDVTFHFFIPPHCALAWINKDSFSSYIGGLLYALDKIESFPHICLYAFDDVPEITCNTANYNDGMHYGIGVDRYILKSMKAGKHRITKANVLEYLRRMADVLLNFDPTPDFEHTVTFEGPINEESAKAFATLPPPIGPHPLDP
ncbi:MAG: hypothetical protein LBD15_02755 [Holosporales bacterium]|nr:hypothetical protein [Holosporales bacterium]